MKPDIFSCLIISIVSISVINGQELIKETKTNGSIKEVYFVLKDNKSILQGEYIATFSYLMDDKYILEYGNYYENKKVGKWVNFYYMEPNNSLKSMGYYKDGKKDGYWSYYYCKNNSGTTSLNFFGTGKITNLILPDEKGKNIQIEIDTSGLHIMANGQYLEDLKTGIWEYYSQSGTIVQGTIIPQKRCSRI
jgi:uncharacterized protein